MEKRIIFYIIDDDEQTTELLHTLITKVFPTMYVKRFHDGFSAWKSLEKEKLDVVLICEFDVEGINGLQILKKLRSDQRLKNTYFIMMTTSQDRDVIIKSVQAGVDDFISKPVSIDIFLLKLKITSKILNLNSNSSKLEEELEFIKKELEPQAQKVRNVFLNIQKIRLPEKENEIKRIIAASNFIAKQLTGDLDELKAIELVAELCYVPKAMFKDRYTEMPVMISGIVQNSAMGVYNDYVSKLFSELRGFEKTFSILNSVYENFDGSGIPAKVKAWAIPLGSRILRVAIDFETFYARNSKNIERIIPMMWAEINRVYDFRVLAFYDQYLGYLNTMSSVTKRATEAVVNPYVLEKGMVLSRSIITISGLKLLNFNTKLEDESIKKIQEAKAAEAYLGHIFVKIESIPIKNLH